MKNTLILMTVMFIMVMGMLFGIQKMSSNIKNIEVRKVAPGINCATVTTVAFTSIDCWKVK